MKLAVAASLLALGCTSSPKGPGEVLDEGELNEDGGTQADPVPAKTGPYAVTTTVDFTVEAILPPQLALVVATLRAFEENPASALFDVAEQQGVPGVGLIRGALPDVLENKLEGWINEYVAKVKIDGRPISEYAGEMANFAEIALTQFAVESDLTVADGATSHTLTALDLSPTGFDIRVPIGGLAADLLTQTPTLTTTTGGHFELGAQHFGLNYGEYAWQGIELLSQQVFGGTVRQVLGQAVNCEALAEAIAAKCVGLVCVGHETELGNVCRGGLDAIVDIAHGRLAAQRLEALHLAQGDARLVDADGDGYGDAIVDGAWDAELNIGFGLRYAPAAFEGSR